MNRAFLGRVVHFRDPAGITASPAVRELINFRQPVAVLLFAVLHFVPDADDPRCLLATSAPIVPCSRAQIEGFFNGFDLPPPGVAGISQWPVPGCPGGRPRGALGMVTRAARTDAGQHGRGPGVEALTGSGRNR